MSYVPPWSDGAFSNRVLPQVQGSLTLNQVKDIEDEVETYLAWQEEKAELEARASALLQPDVQPGPEKQPSIALITATSIATGPQLPTRRTRDHCDFAPTRVRFGKKGPSTASVTALDKAAKEKLVADVMETSDMDNLIIMQKLKDRLAAAGIQQPGVEVCFKDVTASVKVFTGSRSLPTLPNAALTMLEGIFAPILKRLAPKEGNSKNLVMLDNVSGVLKPGRLTLLLGPPGAGKSTLMRVLAGQMKDKAVKVEGSVTYNNKKLNEFVVERTAAYVDQVDKHIGEMTVRETTAFSARMTGQGYDADPMWPLLKAKEQALGITPDPKLDELATQISSQREGDNIMVEIIGKILGLDICMDTVVGNDLLKGISGGQKKRVTTAEMAVGRFPLMFMDEISTGLDSASTYLITKSLKNLCTYLRLNIVVALLQPSPEVYDIFDDIMLMGDGRILYHGPREEILPFFSTLGLECPKRKGVADFLQEVTSVKDQPQYFADQSVPHAFINTAAVAAAFKSSTQGVQRAQEVSEHSTRTYTELDMLKLVGKRYALHTWDMLSCILTREHLLIMRMKAFVIVRAVQCVIISVLVGTSFLKQSKSDLIDANYFMSVAFFSLMFMLLGGFAEVPIFIQRLPVFYKQRDYKFYPAWCYCLGGALVRIPDNLLMATLWTVLVYWLVGFYASAGQFFIFYLIMSSMSIFSTAIFRTIAAFCRDETVAQAMGAVVLVLTINTCGFTITRTSIPNWWIWMYWISPLAYAIRALLVNEMNTPDWNTPVQTGPNSTMTLGMYALESRGFQSQTWWVWVGVGVLLGAAIILTVVQAYAITVMDARKDGGSAVLEEEPEPSSTELQPPAGSRPGSGVKTASVTLTVGEPGDLEAGKSVSKAKTETLGFVPFCLAFRKIKYYVPKPGGKAGEELCLLQGIDGCFRPGVLTALMGASGAGKTTLMDVLAGRKTGGRMEGDQLLNGHTKVQATFSRVMGYVEQFDIHSPQQTVLEALLFSGRMRLPQDMAREKTDKFIGEVMDLVELHPLAHALIGLPGVYGLSVEQRKRLTIAVELVANPSVVFMDEPTSGLDARAAAIVMRVVRNTVNTGRTVVCTIHQPSLDIFQAFDELLLLKRGGETIFFGNMGKEQEFLIEHLESVPGVAKFQAGYNPANWMLEVTAPGAEKALGVNFAQLYIDSPLNARNQKLLDEVCTLVPGTVPLAFDTPFSVDTMTQFRLILHRNFVTYWRSPNYNLIRGLITIFVGLVFGSLYWDIGMQRSTVIEVLNIMGAIYSSSVFLGVSNCMTVLPVIQNERVVYYREKASGMYSSYPYAVAQGLVELPYLICQSIVYCLIIYWMIGFEADVVKFFWFLLFLFLNFCVLTYFGIMAINLTPAVQFGTVFVAFFFTLWNFFCGFLQTKTDIPNYWVWMYYWQPLSWSIYGLVASQLSDVTDTYIAVAPGVTMTVSAYMEEQYGYKHDFIGWIVLILGGFIIVFRSVAAYALLRLNFQKR